MDIYSISFLFSKIATDMLLVVISPEHSVNSETEIVNKLLADGLIRIHIRKPQFSTRDYMAYIASIDQQYYSRLVIHGSFELYHELKLAGIHLNSTARNNTNVWHQIENIPPAAISTSFHSWQEVEDNGFPYGYVFISPVFDSISKAGYKGNIELNGLTATRQKLATQGRYCPKIIGLGGVGEKQIKTLSAYSFDGVAMLGAVWQAPDPVVAYRRIASTVSHL